MNHGHLKNSPDKSLSLSERQQQILGLLAEGKSNKEIAADLAIEQGTVKQHFIV
ncbi:helix-turn-helix domain-containing protein [Polynucleobacter necessarius]|uniref:helix-turn-helix domain-containing protein n=1 Tax=Polynucleobacter necessarius TaxID=576610 RepID=UPI0039E5683F